MPYMRHASYLVFVMAAAFACDACGRFFATEVDQKKHLGSCRARSITSFDDAIAVLGASANDEGEAMEVGSSDCACVHACVGGWVVSYVTNEWGRAGACTHVGAYEWGRAGACTSVLTPTNDNMTNTPQLT